MSRPLTLSQRVCLADAARGTIARRQRYQPALELERRGLLRRAVSYAKGDLMHGGGFAPWALHVYQITDAGHAWRAAYQASWEARRARRRRGAA